MTFLKKSLIFVSLLTFFFCGDTFAQSPSPSPEKTIEYINKMLSPKCTLEVNRGKFTAQYFDDHKTLIREDKVDVEDLDFREIGYDPKEKVLFIPCSYKGGNCVFRKMFVNGNSRFYPRISFVVDGKDANPPGLKKAFVHLLQIMNDKKYHGTITLE